MNKNIKITNREERRKKKTLGQPTISHCKISTQQPTKGKKKCCRRNKSAIFTKIKKKTLENPVYLVTKMQ